MTTHRDGCSVAVLLVVLGLVAAAPSTPAAKDAASAAPRLLQQEKAVLSHDSTDEELLLVHVLFRHGDRTPDKPTYPNDPYANYSYDPMGWAMLTPTGRQTGFGIGSFLRQRYGALLGDYRQGVVAARSTDWARTKETMALVLAGLFPPSELDQWGAGLGRMWMPIAFNTTPKNQDKVLLVMNVPCPVYDKLFQEALHSQEFQKEFKGTFAPLVEYLEEHSGAKLNEPVDVYNIYQALLAQRGLNLTIPAWAEKIFPDQIKPLTALYFELASYNAQMQRLRGGPLLKEILNNTENALQRILDDRSERDPKMFLYGAHDDNIGFILRALKLWKRFVPAYGTAIIFEVRVKDGVVGLQIYLRDPLAAELLPLTIPDCDHFCPLHKVLELTADVIPVDWDAECQESNAPARVR